MNVPLSAITNLSLQNLNNNEYKILTYCLKHEIAISTKQNNILDYSETLWDQLESKNILKKNFSSIQRANNSIRAKSLSLLDLDAQQITKGKSKITMINNLLKDAVILKPDKENGIVLLENNVYRTSVKHLFSDKSKFRIVETDPTFTRLDSVQGYLRKLRIRNEISEEVYKRLHP